MAAVLPSMSAFPARLGLGGRLLEMNLHLDVVDPSERNQVVLTACLRIILGELDRIAPFQMVHGSHMHAVGTNHFHVFLDRHWCNHAILHLIEEITPRYG